MLTQYAQLSRPDRVPFGGFMHDCFQGENVDYALNNAMPGQHKRV